MDSIKFWHRIELPDGSFTPGEVQHGPDGGDWPTTRFGLPGDLTGKTVLDIGAWDGFFSFEAEKRGAREVVASDRLDGIDCNWGGTAGFEFCKKQLKSKVQYLKLNIENPPRLDPFDIVFCFGVLYHLKSPLLAMENLAKLTNEVCLLETAKSYLPGAPVLEYVPGQDNDESNYFAPNDEWVIKAALKVGFKKAYKIFDGHKRGTYRLEK